MLFLSKNLFHRLIKSVSLKEMSSLSFVQSLNTINNKVEWKVVPDDYDYNQEIATSCYGDMLHDTERNQKFGEALKKAIKKLHNSGRKAHVLDIGTGTGLLSMLAVRHGADSVVACEAFSPMANCALKILKENNYLDKIKIVHSHSTSITVGEKGDLNFKANILVSEVFDTELIGEGAIKTFNHAFEYLLEDDCIVIPCSGTVYAQVIESDLALKWNKVEDWKAGEETLVKIPEKIKNCPGTGAVHDIQLSEFDLKHFKILSPPVPVFRFDWGKTKKIPTSSQNKSVMKSISSGKTQAVFMWWELNMDEEGKILLSCAPVWEHPDVKGKSTETNVKNLAKTIPWRDHWMQAVYFIPNELSVKTNELFTLVSCHDEYSFWFEIEGTSKNLNTLKPICNCSFHFLLSRTRIGAINDDRRRVTYQKTLRAALNKDTICIVLSDVSLLAVLCGRLGAKKVYVLTNNPLVESMCRILSVENKLTDVISVSSDVSQMIENLSKDVLSSDVLILSEPYFRHYILPWDNMAFWYMKNEIVDGFRKLNQIMSIRTFPRKCRLNCCAVQFDNLWKIATPLKVCEGFSMRIFDDLIAEAKAKAENYTEAQPLWEYPGMALTNALTVFEFDFDEKIPKFRIEHDGTLEFKCPGRCDGVALWMEYSFADDSWLSFGPLQEISVGEYISWDMFEKQGVHLFRKQVDVISGDLIYYKAEFDPQEAEFNFNFSFVPEANV